MYMKKWSEFWGGINPFIPPRVYAPETLSFTNQTNTSINTVYTIYLSNSINLPHRLDNIVQTQTLMKYTQL